MIITGLPGAGKTTLARNLARRYSLPLICKDTIKEPLLDACAVDSRALSNISFAVMFSMANELLRLGGSLILEGNFRAGEHEAPLLAMPPVNIVQVLCRLDDEERRARMLARARDASRHPGHRDANQAGYVCECDTFLEVPGRRRLFDSSSANAAAAFDALTESLARAAN